MPDTAIRLAAVAAAMTDAELSDILTSVSEGADVTPEQRAGIDEAALRLKTGQIRCSDESGNTGARSSN